MKKNIIYLLMITLAITAGGCKKSFLEITPKGRLVARTTNDYALLMNSVSLYADEIGGGWRAIALMGDDVAAEDSYLASAKLPSQNAFKWSADLFQSGQGYDLSQALTSLYTCNKVINEVMNSTEGSDADKKAILAEAQANRAWIYFTLINFYGKPYLSSSAAQDLGFPIIKTADITVNSFTRNTVQEVYDFMIQDLTAASSALPLQNAIGSTRWNKAAAEGVLGKIYLFMGKDQQALDLFNASFKDIAAQNNPAVLYDLNKEFGPGGRFVPISSDGPANSPGLDYTDNTESVLSRTFYNGPDNGNTFNNDFIVLSPGAQALFSAADLRLNFYAAQFPYQEPNPSGRLSKYSEQYVKYGLQLPELYLLRAEAKARLNDLAGAAADLLYLRQHRLPQSDAVIPASATAAKTPMLRFIMDERTREFATEGYRWLDMRRLSVDPLFSGATYTHILYKDDTFSNTTTFTLTADRLTLRLPPAIMQANPSFQNNP
ncbi:RagB/SusD family nutrient uptake outer membrane protein [Mucilaginibacter rubeus]|uniref:RagB/SusD family nutrient uptake outer membrane protein n=1 Tax=Mucilaginibacter rubeus TaxID=2027860 RepID=A0A5C1I1F1_9SPHI|nr:RagB/SusD family nutrient uptake outer membrane protein [Mucilaginibacter rubeus]QEM11743.1 RagB/SusD family nutrient uptake outer membrane protein [Mucilaginibacter rubeus]